MRVRSVAVCAAKSSRVNEGEGAEEEEEEEAEEEAEEVEDDEVVEEEEGSRTAARPVAARGSVLTPVVAGPVALVPKVA